jgi:hypothetical protein
MDSFIVAAWAHDPELIPMEVGFSIPESVEPFEEGEPPLFLRALEMIHSKCDLFHYRAIVNALEFHNFSTPPSSDSEGGGQGGSSGNDDNGYPRYDPGKGFLDSWLCVRRFFSRNSPTGEPWPSLPVGSSGVSWSSASMFEKGELAFVSSRCHVGIGARPFDCLPRKGSQFEFPAP